MDSSFVWIVMLGGAAVAWLGVLLITSERELKVRRREIEALLTKLENSPQVSTSPQSMASEAEQTEIADLRAQSRNLQDQLTTLRKELDQSRNTIADLQVSQQHSASSQTGDHLSAVSNQDGNAHMQAEIDNLRAMLSESHAKIRELDSARQNLPDVNAITAAYDQERNILQQRMAELENRHSMDQEKLAELQTTRARLAEAETIQNSLREEIRRHEAEIPRWQARLGAADENRQRLAALQLPCNDLLSKQAALADRQRQLQEELVAFARQIAAATNGTDPLNTPT